MTTGMPHPNMLSLNQLMPTLKKTGKLPCAIELSVVECMDVTKPTSTGVVHVLEGTTKDERYGLPLLTLTDGTAAIKALEMRTRRTSSEPQFTQGAKIRIARGAPFKKGFLLLYSGSITVLEGGSRPLDYLHKKSGSDSEAPPFKPYPQSHHGHSEALPTIGTASDIHQNNDPPNGIYRWGMHGSSEGRPRKQASTSQRRRLDRHVRHGEVEAFRPNCTGKVDQDTHYGCKDSHGTATQLQARPTYNNQRSAATDFRSSPTHNGQCNTTENVQRRPTYENQGRSRPPLPQYTASYNRVDYPVQYQDNTSNGALFIFAVAFIIIIASCLEHYSLSKQM